MSNKIEIDPKFCNENYKRPKAKNVGELIRLLQELPPSLPVMGGWSASKKGAYLIVYNDTQPDRFLTLSEDP